MDTLYDAALQFQKLKNYEYTIVLGYKNKSSSINLRFFEDNFFHLCGFQYLRDVSKINELSNSSKALNSVLNGEITQKDIETSENYKLHGIADRISAVANLSSLLNDFLKKSNINIFKYNNNANPFSKIKGDYLLKIQAPDNKTIYFVLKKHRNADNKYFGLSIFSRNLEIENDFAKGHTPNTLLYAAITPLSKEREQQQILYKHPKYDPPEVNVGNIKIIRFKSLNRQNEFVDVLTKSHYTFGQAVSDFFGRIKDHLYNSKIHKKFYKALVSYDKQLPNNKTIIVNEKENAELKPKVENKSIFDVTQNELVKNTTANIKSSQIHTETSSSKSFSQGLEDLKERARKINEARKNGIDQTQNHKPNKPKH